MRNILVAICAIVFTNGATGLTITTSVVSRLRYDTVFTSVLFVSSVSICCHRHKNHHQRMPGSAQKERCCLQVLGAKPKLYSGEDNVSPEVPFVSKSFASEQQRGNQHKLSHRISETQRNIREHIREDVDQTPTIKFVKDRYMKSKFSDHINSAVDTKGNSCSTNEVGNQQKAEHVFGWDHGEFMDRLSP
mmetsp:Transcript_6747/g.9924  ORF Transcript_6747/g.9924 Transcript_6747/m.9924 type:complete len:190 (+) Transcript_6747:64-633(+)